MAFSLRVHGNLAFAKLDDLLHDSEPEAKAVIIELGSASKSTKLADQLW